LESLPSYSELPLFPFKNYPVFIFSTAALSYAKRRRTLDRWKASAIIPRSDRCTPDHPTNDCEQPNQLAGVIIPQLLSRVASQVPRAIHVPACRRFPINCASLDRRPYQVVLGLSTFASPSARIRAFRRLHLTLAGRVLQPLSCPYRRPGSTSSSRITPTSLQ
jgi:hypothetical protein